MSSYNLLRPGNLLRLFLAMAALALVLRLAGPYLISSDHIQREIEARVSGWTDARLSFSGAPSFAFWPNPRVGFDNARLRNQKLTENEGADLLSAEHISVRFSIIGSLFGGPDLGEVEFVRPVFHVRRDAEGRSNWQDGGKTDAASAQAAPKPATVIVRDGTVVIDDMPRNEHYRITKIEGKIDWPETSSGLKMSLQGVVGGKVINWRLSADEPLALLQGGTGAVHTSLNSDFLGIDFDGTANLSKGVFATGRVRIATPSLGQFLAWRGVNWVQAGERDAMTVEGTMTANGYTARLDRLTLSVQGSTAKGILDLSLPPRRAPKVGGTLAFDRIDLLSLLEVLAPPTQDDGSLPSTALGGIDLDLRLSSEEALIEPLVLSDFAAGVRANDGRASLDIGDAALLGGRLSGRLALNQGHPRSGGELQLSLSDVDLGALASQLRISGPLPNGRGSAHVELFTDNPWRALEGADLTGMFALRFDHGAISGFDHSAFEQLAHGNAPFGMKQAAGGSFEFTAATLEGRLDQGFAELSRATFEGTEKTLTVSGMIPYRGGSVAMAGSIQDRQGADPAVVSPRVNFLLGGPWAELVISPLKPLAELPDD